MGRSCLSITADVYAGCDIRAACIEACAMASRLLVDVHFDFSGVMCIALPGGDPEVLQENWEHELKSLHQPKVVSTHPRHSSAGEKHG